MSCVFTFAARPFDVCTKNNLRPTAANHGSRSQAPGLPGTAPLASVPAPAFRVPPPSPPPCPSVAPSTTTSTRNSNPALRLACQGTFGTSVPAATQPLPASLAAVPIVLETTRPRETGTADTTGEGGGGKSNNNNNNNKKRSAAIQSTFQNRNNGRGESLSIQEVGNGGRRRKRRSCCGNSTAARRRAKKTKKKHQT